MFSWSKQSNNHQPSKPGTGGIPIEFISFNDSTKKFTVGEQAIKALSSIHGPVAVVAVCGRARQGKSFILNQLLGRSTGFQIGPTHKPCTKGLWIWSSPIETKLPNGKKYHLVLLDSEGIDAYDQTAQYSVQIFSLAVLLSSLFVYNQMGGIDESALDTLSLVTDMTRHIRVKSKTSDNDESALSEFTPSFLWLLRDFYLELTDNNVQITPKDYLETALRRVDGSGQSVDSKNKIRDSIKRLFPNRDCYTLVRPMNDEKQLSRLDEVDFKTLRPEFREGIQALTTLIFKKAQIKRVGSSSVVTGPVLAALAQQYVAAINDGAVPTISTAWQRVAEGECRRAQELAEAEYHKQFNQNVSANEYDINIEYQRCISAAQLVFDDVAVGDSEIRDTYYQKFLKSIEQQHQIFKQKKLVEAELAIQNKLKQASQMLNTMSRQKGMTVTALKQAMDDFVKEYRADKTVVGPVKWQKLSEFMCNEYAAIASHVEKQVAQSQQEQMGRLQSKLKDQDQSIQGLQSELERQRGLAEEGQKSSNVVKAQKQELQQLQQQETVLQTEIHKLQQEINSARQQLAEKDHGQAALNQDLANAQHQVNTTQQKLQAAQTEVQRLSGIVSDQKSCISKLEMSIDETQGQAAHAAQERGEAQSQLSALQKQLSTAELNNQQAMAQSKQAGQQLSSAQAQVDSLQQQVDTTVAKLTQATTELAQLKELHATTCSARAAAEARAANAESEIEQISNKLKALETEIAKQQAGDVVLASKRARTGGAMGREAGVDMVENGQQENVDPQTLTIAQIKSAMVERGLEGEVYKLNEQKAKKKDWVTAYSSLIK